MNHFPPCQCAVHLLRSLGIGVLLASVTIGSDDVASAGRRVSPAQEASPPYAGMHSTRGMSLAQETVTELARPQEADLPITAPPTRTTFMAHWPWIAGAEGYRLDVSTDPSFQTFVPEFRDVDVGVAAARVVTGLKPGRTYYYRVRSYDARGAGENSATIAAATAPGAGLIILATFDSSITRSANAAAIEGAVNRAISIYETLFSDPIIVYILFRYSTTRPNGSPIASQNIAESNWVYYVIDWDSYITDLKSDARTRNDVTANATLPGSALSPDIVPASANGRAIGIPLSPAMFANGRVAQGGPFDGIVTLKSSAPWQFSRPAVGGRYDAQRSVEHEIDEVLGLGSHINFRSDLRPQDLFSWSGRGVRNVGSSGARYFSIDSGLTRIVSFSQNSTGDFGDWLSGSCPQAAPYVQNAFSCSGQVSDVTATSPEGINLDVIGYDLPPLRTAPKIGDLNNDGSPDYVLDNANTGQTAVLYLSNNNQIGSDTGPTLPQGWRLAAVADFDGEGDRDYALVHPATGRTAVWYLAGATYINGAFAPTLPAPWQLVAAGDFNGDSKPDFVLYNATTRQSAIWYLNNNNFVAGALGPTLPPGWQLVGVADFDRNGRLDYLLFNSQTRQSAIWYLSGKAFSAGAYGPTIAAGYQLVDVADFNIDGHPDYLLWNPVTSRTAIWYLNGRVFIRGAYGPSTPPGQ